MSRWSQALFATFLLTNAAHGQANLKPLPTPADAAALALADAKTQPPPLRPLLRYVWVESGDFEEAQALSLTINRISRASTLPRPAPLGKDKLLVLRVNLAHYAPRGADLDEWVKTWEEFQYDPAYSILITKDTLKFVQDAAGEELSVRRKVKKTKDEIVEVPPFKSERDGNTYTKKWVTKEWYEDEEVPVGKLKDFDVVRVPPRHAPAWRELSLIVNSEAPIVRSGYFINRALSTVKDDGLYKTVYGGLYHEFAGIPSKTKKGTDLDALLEQLGIGDAEKGVNFKKVFERLRSDQRVAVFRSEVTSAPRRVDLLPTLNGRLDKGQRIAAVTHDVKRNNVDIAVHPVMNLIDIKPDAHETIFSKANGLHGYALHNGDGVLQNEAPPDVAKDHTIPAPHHGRLQSAISCISCHEAEGSDGWKPLRNDVKKLLGGLGDVFGDGGRLFDPDTMDRLNGLYQGEPEKPLARGRDDFAAAALAATGPWKKSKTQTDVVKLAAQKEVGLYRRYAYDMVSPQKALAELGVDCPPNEAEKLLRTLLPPAQRDQTLGVIPEDPRLLALMSGIPINRIDWDLVYGFAASRSQKTLQTLREIKK